MWVLLGAPPAARPTAPPIAAAASATPAAGAKGKRKAAQPASGAGPSGAGPSGAGPSAGTGAGKKRAVVAAAAPSVDLTAFSPTQLAELQLHIAQLLQGPRK
jgi:hypothetical protein|eukprot:371420-Prymnesium_polylepis.1